MAQAREIEMQGKDLVLAEKTMVVTGGTGGIGFQTAKVLAQTGARVVISGRDEGRAGEARQKLIDETGNSQVDFVIGDVSSMDAIDALAEALLKKCSKIDVLINNAGYMGDVFKKTKDGLEMHFAVNVLSPWRMVHALLPALRASGKARVINVTGGDKPAAVDPDNLQAEKGFKGLMTYTDSKSAMNAMSMVLSKKLESEGITVNVVFPGRASTAMTSGLSMASLPGPMKLCYTCFKCLFKADNGESAARAAQSSIFAATSPDLEGVTGKYYDTDSKLDDLHPTQYDENVQKKIIATIEAAEAAKK